MSDTYLTIAASSEGLYKEKGSKFMAFTYPIQSEEDIKMHLAELRKTYYDARHHCYAYMLGDKQNTYRANDDGEPNHSAGDPILGQIRSRNLTYVLVVVVRYFGGIKLGVSGLIQAYRIAAAEALAAAEIVEKVVTISVTLHFDYLQMNAVMKLVKDYELEILSQQFHTDCQMTVAIRKKLYDEVKEKLAWLPVQIQA